MGQKSFNRANIFSNKQNLRHLDNLINPYITFNPFILIFLIEMSLSIILGKCPTENGELRAPFA